MNDHPRRAGAFGCALLFLACGGSPVAAPEPPPRGPVPALGQRRADRPDDCAPQPGQPPPEPLRVQYDGLAKAARCQREVFTIMGGVTHFLGVECKHCHLEPDYAADTHNKRVANWMATELVPRLALRSGEQVWCKDCHAGKPKFLGNPRRPDFAVDWMLTHMVDDFQTNRGLPPKCKDCHGGDLGSAAFQPKVILTGLGGSAPVSPVPSSSVSVPVPSSSVSVPVPSSPVPAPPSPIPDFGGR